MSKPRALKRPRVMSSAIAMARRCGRAIYAAMIRRAKSTQLSAAARLRPRFLTQRYQFKGRAMTNKQPTIWDILGAAVMGAILGAMLAYGLLGGF
jgi:hypothetical protein